METPAQALLIERLLKRISPVVPGVKLAYKRHSKLMKLISKLLFFNKKFMTKYYTTLGSTIYIPDSHPATPLNLEVIAHECKHIYDSRQHPILYNLGYMFPQIMALFAFLALGAIWSSLSWLWCLLFLIFLAPIPSPGRMLIERQGYLMSLACEYWLNGRVNASSYTWIAKHFTGPNYYWMWPFSRRRIMLWFVNQVGKIIDEGDVPDRVFVVIRDFIRHEKLLKGNGGKNGKT